MLCCEMCLTTSGISIKETTTPYMQLNKVAGWSLCFCPAGSTNFTRGTCHENICVINMGYLLFYCIGEEQFWGYNGVGWEPDGPWCEQQCWGMCTTRLLSFSLLLSHHVWITHSWHQQGDFLIHLHVHAGCIGILLQKTVYYFLSCICWHSCTHLFFIWQKCNIISPIQVS